MVLDSGSDITIIHSKLTTDDQLMGETVTVHTVCDRPIHFPLASVVYMLEITLLIMLWLFPILLRMMLS